jgi:pimeloyl-ACP methyl ester carboxylesterase
MTSTAIAARRYGSGAPVVLLHPAGFGSSILGPVVELLAVDVEVIVPDRRGYGASADLAPPTSIDDASDDLAALLDRFELDRVTVVGVSAGATLSLAFALRHPHRTAATLSHEPLLGPLAPGLHEIVTGRIAALLAEPDDDETAAVSVFMSELVGTRTWNRLQPPWREDVRTNAAATRREVALFPSFATSPADLGRLAAGGVISSIGSRSGPGRREVADVLVANGVPVRTVEDAGHLPFVDAPSSFADLVLDVAGSKVGS